MKRPKWSHAVSFFGFIFCNVVMVLYVLIHIFVKRHSALDYFITSAEMAVVWWIESLRFMDSEWPYRKNKVHNKGEGTTDGK